jgi:hypothetical protein
MYEYVNNPKYGLLCVRHFNHFEGAESTKALITITRLLSEKDRQSLKLLAVDFRKVKSASLYNTDRALHILMHKKIKGLAQNIRIYRLYDKENPVTQTLLERLNRTENFKKSGTSGMTEFNLFNEQELLTHLKLPEDVKIFNDDLDWQTAEVDPSLPDG